jgi:outer membrane protein assembly factor BamB
VSAVAGVTASIALMAPSQPATAAQTSISLKPSVAHPTASVAVTGAGFGANETVAIAFDATSVASAQTTSAGSLSTAFHVPASALPGKHRVSATGHTTRLSASHTFLVRTNWPRFHFGLANSGFNPYENVIGTSNVSGLVTAWTAPLEAGKYTSDTSPVVANGIVYVGSSAEKLYAFKATPGSKCSGTPLTCRPLWTATFGDGQSASNASPVVADGVVYINSGDGNLYAFSAPGTANCSGVPKVCEPLWTGKGGGGGSLTSVAVARGVVYTGDSGGNLSAFSASGTANCSGTPKTCSPIWTARTPTPSYLSSPAVVNGVIYVGASDSNFSAGHVYAFSALGTTNCSGTPKTCEPLWASSNVGPIVSSPAVANGVVYVGSMDKNLYAFSAAGTADCAGSPKYCAPLWIGPTGGIIYASAPALAYNAVYVGAADGKLYSFGTSGTANCTGTPKTCAPLWTGATGSPIDDSSPAVANGIVYVGSVNNNLYAFAADGSTNCSGTPRTCTPLRTLAATGIINSSPAVADGVVYITTESNMLYAFSD